MALWQRKIYLQPEWDQAANGLISVQEMATVIAERLSALRPINTSVAEDRRHRLIEDFGDLAEDTGATTDDFDSLMEHLYTWGDGALDGHWNGKKVCWIDTFSDVGLKSAPSRDEVSAEHQSAGLTPIEAAIKAAEEVGA
jgi:hypothetical protein